jgi:hypothetical protein
MLYASEHLIQVAGTGKTDQTEKWAEELSGFNCGDVLLQTGMSLYGKKTGCVFDDAEFGSIFNRVCEKLALRAAYELQYSSCHEVRRFIYTVHLVHKNYTLILIGKSQ